MTIMAIYQYVSSAVVFCSVGELVVICTWMMMMNDDVCCVVVCCVGCSWDTDGV